MIELRHSRPITYLQHLKTWKKKNKNKNKNKNKTKQNKNLPSINYIYSLPNKTLKYALGPIMCTLTLVLPYFFSFNSESTHGINQNNYYITMFHQWSESINCRNSMTDYICPKELSHISQNVAALSWLVMLVVGLIDIEHMQSVIKVFFFLSFFPPKIATILVICKPSDHETPSSLQQLSEGVSHNIEEKKSQLCFRANPFIQSPRFHE